MTFKQFMILAANPVCFVLTAIGAWEGNRFCLAMFIPVCALDTIIDVIRLQQGKL